MSTVNQLHIEAMDIAENAFLYRRKGDLEGAKRMFLEAMHIEQSAAFMLSASPENEPSRSILFRSAASLAYNGGDFDIAERLVAHGLSGFPPTEINEELKDLFDEITFSRHLSIKGMELSDAEWKMTLMGSAIAKGVAQADLLLTRVEKVTTLVRRTVERKLGLPFQVNNKNANDQRRDRYGLFVRAIIPSSFAVIFQLGKPDKQLALFEFGDIEPREVVDEILACLELLEDERVDDLRQRFSDPIYFDNFVGLAKQIAPDGKEIKTVGFTVLRDGKEKPVAIRKNRQEIKQEFSKSNLPQENVQDELTSINLEGILRYANAPISKKLGVVKLVEDTTGDTHKIFVPIGVMKDVVQPYFDERVSITVTKGKDGKLYYEDVK